MPGHWELLVLGLVVLLLFGSKQLPTIARNLGRGVREVRETVVDVDPRTSLRELEAPQPEATSADNRAAARAPAPQRPPADRPGD
jgi:sec-independent protein translocase protein TatA